jgi:hypothetical protein
MYIQSWPSFSETLFDSFIDVVVLVAAAAAAAAFVQMIGYAFNIKSCHLVRTR